MLGHKHATATCGDGFRIYVPMTDFNRDEKIASARDYLWRHWQLKRCAELYETGASKEGSPFVVHYSVARAGPKSVVLSVDAWTGRRRRYYSHDMVTSVIRIKPRNPFWDRIVPITVVEFLPPNQYRLLFKDQDGQRIGEF